MALKISEKIIRKKRKGALSYLKEIISKVTQNCQIKESWLLVEKLENSGVLYVLIGTLARLNQLYDKGLCSEGFVRSKIEEILDIAERIVKKEPGEDVSPTLYGKKLSFSVMMVGKSRVMVKGKYPYKKWIERCERNHVQTVYILSLGLKNRFAKKIAEMFNDRKTAENTFVVYIKKRKGDEKETYCYLAVLKLELPFYKRAYLKMKNKALSFVPQKISHF